MLCSLLSTGWWAGFFGEADTSSLVGGLGADIEVLLHGWRRRQERALLVRYEDLVAQPERALESALAFAGLDSSTSTVRRMVEHGFAEIPELREHRTTESAEASVGRWRRDLDPALQKLCADLFGDALAAFGYEL